MDKVFSSIKDFSTLIVPLLVAAVSVLVLLKARQVQFGSLSIDLDKNSKKNRETSESDDFIVENTSDVSYSANEKQFLLLKQYHAQGLAQSRISFWFSLIFASLGFAVIVISILSADKDKSILNQPNAIISLVSGTIIDVVSALFFVQSNKSRELMSTFFEKLRTDRKIEESLRLSDSITDEKMRSKIKMILSLHFAEIVTSDNIVSMVLKDLDKPES